jgi:hypothetical protein
MLPKNWHNMSSLRSVIFESGESLLKMIEIGQLDLEGNFDIWVVQCDGVVSFPGYSVSMVPGVDNLLRLERRRRESDE